MSPYSGYKLCSDLSPKEKCFRVEVYNEGVFEEIYHQHIPAFRISKKSHAEALRALIINNTEHNNEFLLLSFLNERSKNPEKIKSFRYHSETPESGVLRLYCSSSRINSWVDEVISPSSFRSENNY